MRQTPALKMHADEADIDAAIVRRLLAAQLPQWAKLAIELVKSPGTDNELYRLGDDMVVRLPRIEGAVKHVGKEQRWLPRIAPLLPVAIPVPLGKGAPGEGYSWPWSVYRWLDGENPTAGHIIDPHLLTKELAEFITALHQVNLLDGPPASRGVPLAKRDASTRSAIKDLHKLIDADAATAAWEAALQIHEWPGPAVWIHGDLSPGNVLVKDGRLSAVIDFGSMGVGDPACDLIIAWNLLPSNVRDVFHAALQIDDATWERGRGWALSIALIQLPYYKDTNQGMADNARHVIREIIDPHNKIGRP